MYKTIKLYVLGHLLFMLTQSLYGADDHESWTKVSIQKKIPFFLKLELSQGLRFKDYVETFNQAFFELTLSYKNVNGLRINIPYRYTVFEEKIKHRLSFAVSYQYSFKPVSLKYRIKFYRLYKNGEPLGEGGVALGDLIRSKYTIKFKSGKKANPYISGEWFHLINISSNPFDEYRAYFGIEIDLPRKNSMNIFYILKKEDLSKSNPDKINVFGLSYTLKL